MDLSPDQLKIITGILAVQVPGCEVRAFGSRVNGKAKKFSDLDIVIMSEAPVTSMKMASIKDAFSESNLPFRVDVLDWSSIGDEFRKIISRKYEALQYPGKMSKLNPVFESPIRQYIDKILAVTDDYPEILFCSVYGSIAQNKLTAGSDIDIAVAGKSPIPLEKMVELSVKLSDACQREIDLVDLQAKSGVILQQVLCEGKVILKKSSELYARLIIKMWYNQADMMPNVRAIWDARRNRMKGVTK